MKKFLFIYSCICNNFNESTLWTTDRILILITIIISLFSLISAVIFNRKTLKITINHNKKSIIPSITFNRNYTSINQSSEFTITNSGFGPAIITKVSFIYNEISYDSIHDLLKANISIAQLAFLEKESRESKLDNREVLAPGKEQDIYSLKFSKGINFDDVRTKLSNSKFIIEFENLYGDKFLEECHL